MDILKISDIQDEKILPYVNSAMKNKSEYINFLLDKNLIKKISDRYDVFSEENLDLIYKASDEIRKDEDYKNILALYYELMKSDIDLSEFSINEFNDLKSEFALVFPVIHLCFDSCLDMEKRGIDVSIVKKSIQAVDSCIKENENLTGKRGTSAFFFWLPYYAKGKLFFIDGFEFEIKNEAGTDILGVHIPKGRKLERKDNLLAFKSAFEFFKKYYPEYDFKGFNCESWLLNPEIKNILGKESNISKFGDMFDRYTLENDKGMGVYRFVYGKVSDTDTDSLKEETSLQKKMKKYLKEGNVFHALGGNISLDKLEKMLKE